MTYRAIALDLDGTLLRSPTEMTPRTREALKAARERGIVSVVATGRTPHSALYWSQYVGGGPVVCCNGAGVLDDSGRYVLVADIPQDPLERMVDVGRETGVLLECYTTTGIVLDQPLGQMRAYLNWVRPKMKIRQSMHALFTVWHLNRIRPVRSLAQWVRKPNRPPVLKLMAVGQRVGLQRFAQFVREEVPGVEITSSGVDNLEVTASGVNKGSGMELLAARLAIPPEQIIAIGDSDNDLSMIRFAGLGVAMGNATDQVKAVADRITGTTEEDGVAQIIEELLLS